jgi:hypothetical protein
MEQVAKYFNAEKFESVFFVLAGITATLIACYFIFVIKKPFQNGIAYSITVIALIQITVGATVYIRSPKDINRVNQLIQTNKTRIQSEEIPRMNAVMKNFALYKYIEITLIISGIAFFFFFNNELIKGIGLGLIIQSSIMLMLDFIAAARGNEYLKILQNL